MCYTNYEQLFSQSAQAEGEQASTAQGQANRPLPVQEGRTRGGLKGPPVGGGGGRPERSDGL